MFESRWLRRPRSREAKGCSVQRGDLMEGRGLWWWVCTLGTCQRAGSVVLCVVPGVGLPASSSAAGGEEEKLRCFRCPQYTACWLPCSTFFSWLPPVGRVWMFGVFSVCLLSVFVASFSSLCLWNESLLIVFKQGALVYLNMFVRLNPPYCI